MITQDMAGISKVDVNLWRGPRPDNMDELKVLGIRQIINLEVGWFEAFHGLWEQEQHEADLALISYSHCPISDWMFPTKKEFYSVLGFIHAFAGEPHPVKTYVHCLHGQDRTGLVCAAYRVKFMDWKIDDAINEMYSFGFHSFPYKIPFGWEAALRNYLK